jgi:hypothetical protein
MDPLKLNLAQLIESQKRDKSYCVQCYMGKCSKSSKCGNLYKDGVGFKKLVKCLNDPLQIADVKREIVNDVALKKIRERFSGLIPNEILENGFIYTTCLFCYSCGGSGWNKCKNTREGRTGTIETRDGRKVTFCYPDVKGVKHRIQIGLHMNFICSASGDGGVSWNFLEDQSHPTPSVKSDSNATPTPTPTPASLPKTIADDSLLMSEQIAGDLRSSRTFGPCPKRVVSDPPLPQKAEDPKEIDILKSKMEDLLHLLQEKPSMMVLSNEDKRSVNEKVIRENISLKAYIQLLLLKIQRMGSGDDFMMGAKMMVNSLG